MNNNTYKRKTSLIWGMINGFILAIIGFIGLFINPLTVAIGTVWAFGFLTVFTGVFGLVASFKLKKQGVNLWWLLLIQGISGIILGSYLMSSPIITEAYLIQFSGIYLIIFSIARLLTTKEDWFFVILKVLFGISMIAFTGFFLIWGFALLFSIFLVNGAYTIYTNYKILKKS